MNGFLEAALRVLLTYELIRNFMNFYTSKLKKKGLA